MDMHDKTKVIEAGFIILRARDYTGIPGMPRPDLPHQIYYCSRAGAWSLFKDYKFKTKSERDRALKQLLLDPKIISD